MAGPKLGTGSPIAGAVVLTAGLALASCSLSPNFTGSSLFGGEDEAVVDPVVSNAESTDAIDDVPGQDQPYPTIGSVPERSAVPVLTPGQRRRLSDGRAET